MENEMLNALKKEIYLGSPSREIAQAALADDMPYDDVKRMIIEGGDPHKIKALYQAYLRGVDFHALLDLIHPSDGTKEVEMIATGLAWGLSKAQLATVADGQHKYDQMVTVFMGFSEGYSMEEMELATDNRYDEMQISEIVAGLRQGLTYEQVAVYAKEELDCYQMATIRSAAVEKKLTVEEMAFIADSKNNTRVMRAKIKKLLENRGKEE